MIKFFRHIRRTLINQNQMSKYFKYATGEILLVVIGILIAVGINSQYNKSENEKKINAILKQVQQELITDIIDAKRINNEFIAKEETLRQIMRDSSIIKMHEREPFSFLIYNRYVSFSNKKTGYNRFMSNLENLPDAYSVLLPHFNQLYVELQNDIDDYNKTVKDVVLNIFNSKIEQEPNYANYLWVPEYEDEAVKYISDDIFFKNNAVSYINALGNIRGAANDYRIESIVLYKKIDSLLSNKPKVIPAEIKTTPSKDWIQPFLGVYKNVDTINDIQYKLEYKNDKLLSNGIQLFWHENNIFFTKESDLIVKLISNAPNEYSIQINNGPIQALYKK